MSLVNKNEFDELVGNTTRYLQDLVNRVSALEKEVEEMKSKRTTVRNRKAGDNG